MAAWFPRTGKAPPFGASSPKEGERVGRSVKGNGSTLMVISEAQGLSVAFLLEAANTRESQLARDGLTLVKIPRPNRVRPKTLARDLHRSLGDDRGVLHLMHC